MIATTASRVPDNTSEHVNDRIERQTEMDIAQVAAGGPRAIEARLAELDEEWDIERTLEANAATISVIGCALGATVDRRFFVIPAVVGSFLLQHALQGWCPPLPILRRMGIRTAYEISREKYALKALRGDFADVPKADGWNREPVRQALNAAHVE